MTTESQRRSNTWFSVASRPDIVKRSTKVSLMVGSILTVINQGDMFLSGDFSTDLLWKIPLTYCVPYAVSTYAAVDAIISKE